MNNYVPKYLNLHDLIVRRLFKVPDYQRAYRWEKKHRKDLFDDILRSWESDEEHFMATVVGLLTGDKENIVGVDHEYFDVVDGQQRITTLVILLKAIAKSVNPRNNEEKEIGDSLNKELVKQGETLLLQTNHDSNGHFAKYIKEGIRSDPKTAKTQADKNLLDAMKECEDFVRRQWKAKKKRSIAKLHSHLMNRIWFVFHEIQNKSQVYDIFEILNSRGMEVSALERLKSTLMAIVFESEVDDQEGLMDEIQRIWSDIYRMIGLQREDVGVEALKFAATLRNPVSAPSKLLNEPSSVKALSEQSKGNSPNTGDTSAWLRSVTKILVDLLADPRKKAITRVSQARLVAVAVKLRADLSEDHKSEILRRWESVTFRIYGMHRERASALEGEYVRLAWRITQDKLSYRRIMSELKKIGKDYSPRHSAQELKQRNCYATQQLRENIRYFFYKYEEHLAMEEGQSISKEKWETIWEAGAGKSIEHILPQSSEREYVHWLGNLMILPPDRNSGLSNNPPQEKAEDYDEAELLVAKDVAVRIGNAGYKWIKKDVVKRENELLKWAEKEWAD